MINERATKHSSERATKTPIINSVINVPVQRNAIEHTPKIIWVTHGVLNLGCSFPKNAKIS